MLLDIIVAFKTKMLAWIPETQYAPVIYIITINEIFTLYMNQKNNYDMAGV